MGPKMLHAERWVQIDVVATSLGVSESRARTIAKTEGIRSRGTHPKTYALSDVVRVHRARKGDAS